MGATLEKAILLKADLLSDPAIPPLSTYLRAHVQGPPREVYKNVTEPCSSQPQTKSHLNAHQHWSGKTYCSVFVQ